MGGYFFFNPYYTNITSRDNMGEYANGGFGGKIYTQRSRS